MPKVQALSSTSDGFGALPKPLASRLNKLGLFREADLVLHLPLRYEDETQVSPIAGAPLGVSVQVEGVVLSCEISFRPRRQLVARIADETGELTLRFLNFYPSQQKQLAEGTRVRVFGEIRGGFFGDEMVHPRVKTVREGEALPAALTPVYPTTAGLAQSALRKLIDRAMKQVSLADLLPEGLRKSLRLPEFERSVRALHHPQPGMSIAALEDRTHPAWRRIKFEELLAQQLSLRKAYAARRARRAPVLQGSGALSGPLVASLPFALTGAQQRAVDEIARDLATPHPMQRLLQGDVGSGKTIVAALAMLQAAEAGWQAALMAPTEILAEQHFRKLAAWLTPLGIKVAWLAGSQKKKAREAALAMLASGEALLAVGTHALIEDPVAFPKLGLAVVDEQHRFGVRQRLALREKYEGSDAPLPHMLMMSATPIPRTLAMSFYADLDVSVLDELPPGRTPIVTKLVADARRDDVVARVRDACREGRQAYWVCPLIEETEGAADGGAVRGGKGRDREALQLQTAVETCERLTAELPELRVGLVHGRLKADEKAAVMDGFIRNEVQVLVATTVIEVGVDVPNASLMVIEHAERFGLAQLHQLRGRVGRGAAASACILIYSQPLSQTGRARLKVIYENTDGFVIAQEDLRLRGPGEFIGARQSGSALLRYADLEMDVDLVEAARSAAEELLARQPAAAAAILDRWHGGRSEYLKA
ncbi:ATP-dependent DNA helicase RecG [Niveibacterium microcysteis]|uniref:ATP-dependent DNA helicase RecG n=1 Tax=Niveibacterium microcysteis TaxID=2811415 RepID=A0ABX7M606_9RHOO|nr:ATP-dependent DNA helicase RecG [Niveibacterium microcysteis]QSI76129.1 ATP-dependent DNA helicase RecG [Niveibacterium microcysteis]